MEYKRVKFEVKSTNDETGEFEGFASIFRKTPDKVKDIIHAGSFTKTIQENNGMVPLTYPSHEIKHIVGPGIISQNEQGLYVKGKILLGIKEGNDAYLLMKCDPPVIYTMSIGYEAIKTENKAGIRHITEIKLYEIALVPGSLAADDEAVISSVKTEHKAASFEENLNWARLRSLGMSLFDTLYQTIDEILYTPNNPNKPDELEAAINAFHDAFMDWIKSAMEAGMFKTNPQDFAVKVQAAKDVFKALLQKAETKTEPPSGTPQAPADEEAANLANVLDGIQSEIAGVDVKSVDARIEELISKL